MGFFKRLGNIISGKGNSILDDIENPIEQLDLVIRKKKEALVYAKKESATFIGSVPTKETEMNTLEEKIKEYENGIRKALKNNDKEKATSFLKKKKELDNKLNSLKNIKDKTSNQAKLIKEKICTLEDEIAKLESKKEELKARYSTAEASAKVTEMLSGLDDNDILSIEKIENKIKDKENYAEGLNSFKKENPDEDLNDYLNNSIDDLDAELEKYK